MAPVATPDHHWWPSVSARGPPLLPLHLPTPAAEQNTWVQRVQATGTNPQGPPLSPLTGSPLGQGPQRSSGSSEQIPPAANLTKAPQP